MSLHVEFADGKTRYRPGEFVEGVAFWELASAPTAVEVRLFWQTAGKGTVDLEIAQTQRFDGIGAKDRRPFRLALPGSPYSVSGKLVSVVWSVEIVAEPKGDSVSADLVMSPTGDEVRIDREEKP